MNFFESILPTGISYIISLICLLFLIAILHGLKFTYVETFTDEASGCKVIGKYTVEKCGTDIKVRSISADNESVTNILSTKTAISDNAAENTDALAAANASSVILPTTDVAAGAAADAGAGAGAGAGASASPTGVPAESPAASSAGVPAESPTGVPAESPAASPAATPAESPAASESQAAVPQPV